MQHKIEYVDPQSLNPAPYNPRTISDDGLRRLAGLLDTYGFVDPVIARREDRLLIGGHQRLKANQLRKVPDKKIPCIFVDVDDRQAKALNIALNNERAQGQFDENLLAELLQELDSYDGLDLLAETGMSEDELLDLLDDGTPGQTSEDVVPELPKKPKSKSGELYVFGEHRLLCGDSTKIEDVEKLLQGEKADLVFTDPPYGILYLPENKKLSQLGYLKSDTKDVGKFKIFIRDLTKNIVNILRPGGVYYIFMSWEFMGDIVDILRESQCDGHNLLIWDRVKAHFRSYPQDYIPNCEVFLYGWKKGKNRIKNFKTGLEHTTIWRMETLAASEMCHTTQKPVELPANAIQKSSNRNNLVVDLFGGSGSTLIACEKLSRKCRMIEIDPAYCDVIRKRWAEFVHGENCGWENLTPTK